MTDWRDYRFRSALNADGAAIRELVFAVLEEHCLAPDPTGTDADLEDIEAHYRDRGGAFEVVETSSGIIVGCVGIAPVDATTCELRKMYLVATARGRGLGRALLESALKHARDRGFLRVTLETAGVLRQAIDLYVEYGFKPYAPDHLSSRCDQAYALDLVTDAASPA